MKDNYHLRSLESMYRNLKNEFDYYTRIDTYEGIDKDRARKSTRERVESKYKDFLSLVQGVQDNVLPLALACNLDIFDPNAKIECNE